MCQLCVVLRAYLHEMESSFLFKGEHRRAELDRVGLENPLGVFVKVQSMLLMQQSSDKTANFRGRISEASERRRAIDAVPKSRD
jgi:hypothetical protein